jgi:hypothetical protein
MPRRRALRWNSRLLLAEVVEPVGAGLDVGVGRDQKPPVPAAGSWMVSPGWGLMQAMMVSISGRGVKYWPAPLLVSLAFFSSRPSYRSPRPSCLALNQSMPSRALDQLLQVARLLQAGLASA